MLKLSDQDLLQIRTTTDLDELKKYLNPASSHGYEDKRKNTKYKIPEKENKITKYKKYRMLIFPTANNTEAGPLLHVDILAEQH